MIYIYTCIKHWSNWRNELLTKYCRRADESIVPIQNCKANRLVVQTRLKQFESFVGVDLNGFASWKKWAFPGLIPKKVGPIPATPIGWIIHQKRFIKPTEFQYQLLVISSWIPNFSVKSRVIHWSTPQCMVPSGKLTELWKITIFFMGKSTIHGHFQ